MQKFEYMKMHEHVGVKEGLNYPCLDWINNLSYHFGYKNYKQS